MEIQGWIKLHRKLIKWEWYDNPNTRAVFLHLLLTVNFEDGFFHGISVKRGQRAVSLNKLAKECGLERQPMRTTLNNLKSTHELTIETRRDFSLLTVTKYNDYQATNPPANQTSTTNQPTNQPTYIKKEEEKKKEERNISTDGRPEFRNFLAFCKMKGVEVSLKEKKFFEIREEYGPKLIWWTEVQKCINWLSDNGKKVVSAGRLRNWCVNALRFNRERETKIKQEYQDKKNQLAPPKSKSPNLPPLWKAPE